MREAERQMRRNLADGAASATAGEEVKVLAIGQARVGGWRQLAPIVLGSVLVVQGLLTSEGYLPVWAGIAGVVILLAWAVVVARLPLRLITRGERLHVFALPRRTLSEARRGIPSLGAPLESFAPDSLPTLEGGDSVTAAGERIWPHGARRLEKEALRTAVAPRRSDAAPAAEQS
ncbi:hypothetical protein HJD18_15225 [Thermoleophilia bacterium SCSIO 60948]|nr:hypothetical protein HJD18_15225 [Thermoleophilia bacterium SCSIO 60948]